MTMEHAPAVFEGMEPPVVQAARGILDHFGVRRRLEDVRDSVWRGGRVVFRVRAERGNQQQPHAMFYELAAVWETAVFERVPNGVSRLPMPTAGGVITGTWKRVPTGYWLRIGLDLALPASMFVRSPVARYAVPLIERSDEQIRHSLDGVLESYTQLFLDHCPAVPEAQAAARARLRQRGL